MSSLYRKYRPKLFSEITGQEHIVKTLSNSIINNRIGHAYLFTGPRGTGKTTLARIFAKTVNCLDPQKKDSAIEPCNQCANCKMIMENKAMDLIEIDAASHTGVDNIRQLKENVAVPPASLKYKIYIIDEVHMLSTGAFNALLKTLEEPPAHAIFILATTELHKVLDTIISRCQRFDFHRLSQKQIIDRLSQISKKENLEIQQEALEAIALEAEGGMRDAESLLGQIISLEDKKITLQEVSEILGISSQKVALDFIEKILAGDVPAALAIIDKTQSEGLSLKNLNKLVLSYLRNILIFKITPDTAEKIVSTLTPEQTETIKKMADKNQLGDLITAVNLFQKSLLEFKDNFIMQLPLEMAVIEFGFGKNLPAEQPRIADSFQNSSLVVIEKKQPVQPIIEETPSQNQPAEAENLTANVEEKSLTKEKTLASEEISQPRSATLEDLLEKWSEILQGVKPFNHSIHAFLKNCTPLGIKEGKVFIKTKYDFYKDKLSETNNRLTIQKVVDKVMQCKLPICFVTNKESASIKFENQPNSKRNSLHDAMQIIGGRIVK